MLLDSQPKPLAGDIAIQIPPKDKAAPLPVPAEPSAAPAAVPGAATSAAPAAAGSKAVAVEDSVDKGEEVLQAPPAASKPVQAPAVKPVAVAAAKPEHKPEPVKAKAEAKPEHKPEPKPEHKPEPKPEHKADTRLADKSDKADKAEKPAKPKAEDKPARPHDDVRAIAILEGKAADKEKAAEPAAPKQTLQIAAMSSQEKAAELQARLLAAGISSHTEKFGTLIRVKVGPVSKDEAERVRAKLRGMGL
jgi:DedD protein